MLLRLTLLPPEIVVAILNGVAPPDLSLARSLEPFPMFPTAQREVFEPS
jgi:hypothetical protein